MANDITEQEAYTKWCPMARIVVGSVTSDKSNFQGGQAAMNVIIDADNGNRSYMGLCAGSRCMMWQTTGRKSALRDGHPIDDPDVLDADEHGGVISHLVGHCGLVQA